MAQEREREGPRRVPRVSEEARQWRDNTGKGEGGSKGGSEGSKEARWRWQGQMAQLGERERTVLRCREGTGGSKMARGVKKGLRVPRGRE